MAQVLDTYGISIQNKARVQSTIEFQTSDAQKLSLVAANQSGSHNLSIPALSGNQTILHNGSTLDAEKLGVNAATAVASLANADELIVYDASAGANRKITAQNAATFFADGGLPSGTEAQVIVYDASNEAQAVALSGDATIAASGALTIANNAVTGDKIANGGVGAGKLATGAINNAAMFAAGVINNAALGNGAVGTGKIAVGGINQSGMFAAGVVNEAALAADSVATAKIPDSAVTNAKLAGSIADAKLASGPTTLGTWQASKFCSTDSNNDASGGRNLTLTGTAQADIVNVGGAVAWRMRVNGGNLQLQKWSGSAWVTKQEFDGS